VWNGDTAELWKCGRNKLLELDVRGSLRPLETWR